MGDRVTVEILYPSLNNNDGINESTALIRRSQDSYSLLNVIN